MNIKTDNWCGIQIEDTTQYPLKGYNESELVHFITLQNVTTDTILSSEESFFSQTKDGVYNILIIHIPTKEAFQSHELDESLINYYSDGGKLYKVFNSETSEVLLEELIQVNKALTNILYEEDKFVSICNLKKCYVNLCRDTVYNISECANESEDNFNRDFVWMTINIIDYLVSFGQLDEASNIIKLMLGCNGICESRNSRLDNDQCGCA